MRRRSGVIVGVHHIAADPTSMASNQRVLIAGGGPVGLLCALLLAERGIAVRLFDGNLTLQEDPRAATTHPATLELLGAAGLVEPMKEVGLVAPTFQFWDRPSNRLVAQFDHALLKDDTRYPFVIQCEQFKTARIVFDRLRKLKNVDMLFNHEVVGVSQTDGGVELLVRGPEGIERHAGSFVIGADGGRSTVRKQCDITFEGFTWPERFIVLTTPFDFGAEFGYCPRSYFADPEQWCNCFKVSASGGAGQWRTVFPVNTDASDDEVLGDAFVRALLKKFFSVSRPLELVHRNVYVTHQRVAAKFRLGRVLLAGDAAHVNNPIGGMGLNGGIQDAFNLADKLAEVLLNRAPMTLLDLYDLQRRTVATEFVQQQSIENKKRLEERDPAVRSGNLEELERIAADPVRSRNFLLRTAMIAMQRRAAEISL